MRLISCYIENFGAINKKEIIFDRNLTSVCEENGFGKTTLASFLEAVFYGMDSDRANSKEFGMRRHFNPFGGGKFGGNVVFSAGQNLYKIERYFDEKSEAKDTLTVYKDNELYTGFGDKIGEKIFGIDKPSFERTIFINAHEIEIGSTGSINAKLNNFLEGSTDDTNIEKALEHLDKAAKEYKKTKSGNDLISKEKDCLLRIDEKISNAEKIKASLPEKYERLSAYNEELKILRQKSAAQQKAELVLKDWEQYDDLMSTADLAKQTIEKLTQKYPAGLPSSEELSNIKAHLSAKLTLERQTDKCLTQEEADNLVALQKKYSSKIPTETEINEIRNKINLFINEEAAIRSEEDRQPTEYEKSLQKRFAVHIPTEQTLAQIDNAVAEYERAEKAYAETPDYIVERADKSSVSRSASKKNYLIIAVLAAIVVITGIFILFVQTTAGIILLATGGICLIATGFAYLNKKTSAPVSESIQKINPEKTAKERIKNNAELEVQKLLTPYGYSSDKNIHYLVDKLKSDITAYEELASTERSKAEKLAKKKADHAKLQGELNDYFSAYGFIDGDFQHRISALKDEISCYITLLKMQDNLNQKNAENSKMLDEHKRAISNFCLKYQFDDQKLAQLHDIEADVADYKQADRDYTESLKKAGQLKEEKGLTVRPLLSESGDAEELNKKIDDLNKEISTLNNEISECESEAEKLDNLHIERQRHTELLDKYKSDYNLLMLTSEFLKEADKRLKDKYIAPIKNNFLGYAELLEDTLGEKVTMTPSFELRYERNGIERSEKHLSAGQRSICAFCFRMALIENMYTEETPFLILDDPFVNLDQKHMDRVKTMLKKLSEKMQLIYFTCHESRAI